MYPDNYQSGYDAIQTMVERHSRQKNIKGPEDLAYFLVDNGYWPNLSHESLMARWRACINPSKDQYFKTSEITAMMNYTGFYDPLFFICDQLGFERPKMIPEEIVLSDAMNQIERMSSELQSVVKIVHRLASKQKEQPEQTTNTVRAFSKKSTVDEY